MLLVFKVILLAMPLSQQAVIVSSPRKARLTLGESSPSYYYSNIDGHPGTYAFGYDVRDPQTGNVQFRNEERYPNGTVVGNYGYYDANGRLHNYRYVADKRGYRVSNTLPRYPASPPAQATFAGEESSVTWSRPKKNRNQYSNKNYFTKLPINRGNVVSPNNVLLPPSHYAVD